MILGITDIGAYIIGTIAVILLPGPNSLYCLAVAGQSNTQTAYRAVAAIILGDGILMLATALGAGTIFHTMPTVFHAVKTAGAIYLAYLGIQLCHGGWKKWRIRHQTPHTNLAPIAPNHVFKRALLLSLSNPKAILFFLSFFVQFVSPDYPKPWLSFLILALILEIISFSYLSVLVLAGQKLVQHFRRHHNLASIGMITVGMMFIGFALRLYWA